MLEICIFDVKIRLYFGFFAAVIFSYFYSGAAVAAAVACCFLHELGHLAAMCLFSCTPESICLYAGGIKILPRRGDILPRAAEAVILSAGCMVNFLLAAVSRRLGLIELTEINLALGIFNIMPFSYFDGGRLLSLFAPEPLRRLAAVFCAFALALAVILCGETLSPAAAAAIFLAAAAEFFM